MKRRPAFTLIELLVVLGIMALLLALLFPLIRLALERGRLAACTSNLRQVYTAYVAYLGEHDGKFFPWMESQSGGKLWYWGFEPSAGGGAEGGRELDMGQARLAPYLGGRSAVSTCPSLPYSKPYFKKKFKLSSYGYGLNVYLLSDTPQCRQAGVYYFENIEKPWDTIVWGDAIQINTFQAPASPRNPLLEEWYMLDKATPQKYHFRHGNLCNLVFADGSIRAWPPSRLYDSCDGKVGELEPAQGDYYLRTRK